MIRLALFLIFFCTSAFGSEVVQVSHEPNGNQINFNFKIKDGWHILAENPGDIGLPTTITIEGAKELSHQWNNPQKFEDEGIVQYGYEKEAFYTAHTKEQPTKYMAKIKWLACFGDECLPEEETFYYNWNKPPLENFWYILLMAFLGGIILNFMPCIFPILSLKAISLIQSAQKSKNVKVESLLYFAGVVASFVIIASILMWLRLTGEQVGWGFQLQSPIFVGILIAIFVIIFLMLLDLINLRNPFANRIGRISFNKAKLDAFVTGFFAVIIASPCTAPFMGIALGYALNQDAYLYYPIFLALAIGYALPFTLIGFFPQALHRIMPKPGRWMELLKKLFSIPIFLTIVWLIWVLSNQLQTNNNQELDWKPYNETKIERDIKNGDKVLINFTAKWCITCLMNEKVAFSSSKFKRLVKRKDISLYKADWTSKNERIAKALAEYKRNSVPLYIYYKKGQYIILPQILTPAILQEKLS